MCLPTSDNDVMSRQMCQGPKHSHCQELSTPSDNCSQAPANLMFLQLKKQTKNNNKKRKWNLTILWPRLQRLPGSMVLREEDMAPHVGGFWKLLGHYRSTCDSTKPGRSHHFSGSGPPHSTTEGLMEEAARHTPLPVYKNSAFLASFLKESSKTT